MAIRLRSKYLPHAVLILFSILFLFPFCGW